MMPQAVMLRDHLMWTKSGVVWATWRLGGLPYGYAGAEAKKLVRAQHRALLQGMSGEALLVSVCAPESAATTAERLLGGAADRSEWRSEVELVHRELLREPSIERTYWLAVPLAGGDLRTRLRAAAAVAETEVRDALALPRRTPPAVLVDEAERAAGRVVDAIPTAFAPRPASPSEVAWLIDRACRRGLPPEPDDVRPAPTEPAGRFVAPTVLTDALLDEGAVTDLDSPPLVRNPFARRFLKVHGARSDDASYQVLLALTSGPKGGWAVPGGEWLAAIDRADVPVDWAVRLSISSGNEVRRRNRSAELSLRDQVEQQDAQSDELLVGQGAQLGEVAASLRDYAAALSRSEDEVEVQATTVLAIGGTSAVEAMQRASAVRQRFRLSEFRFDPPLGGQRQLWWAMQPGIPAQPLVRELAQLTTGGEFASAVPLVATELGDETGLQLGVNLTTGRRSPVLLDPAATIQADRSASIGIVAELGAGKSYALKKIAGDCVDRGARVVIIDRTEAREYATFATSLLPRDTAVVDLSDPAWSIDPLRLFGPDVGARYVRSLFASLLGVRPRDELGVELARLLEPEAARARGLRSLGDLRRELGRETGEAARRILGLVDLIAGTDLGRVLFDGGLPTLDLRARAIIPLTAGLALPTAQELDRQHLFAELPLEKLVGRAMYAFLTGIARQIAFTSRDLTLFCADECHHITTSPEGQAYVLDFLRDGRKHNAMALLASHDPHDFGDVRARGLIPVRMVMRHTDPVLAERALEWLDRGLERDPELVRELTEQTAPAGVDGVVDHARRGEAFLRDARQRIGKIRVVPPQRPERRAALGTTPITAGRRE
ncbi:ATP/GTP-binding protein [Pseudoclavibacter endophyticus]|nr:ATP-binding protein [Pseudoclavibacter endophyticus]GGA69116.1 ATP/GTP-binding protein [Pseudoclavibacter endophyticus]